MTCAGLLTRPKYLNSLKDEQGHFTVDRKRERAQFIELGTSRALRNWPPL